MKLCDLHTHTTASDGSDSPSELVRLAEASGLSAVAITDHDTVSGIEEALRASDQLNIEVIPGVELSVIANKGNMHILGYFIDKDSPALLKTLNIVQKARAERNPKMVARLNELGIGISMTMLEEMAQGGQVGRPHFARALVELGAVRTVQEAFDRYLKRGAPAYCPKSVLKPVDAIETIHRSNGVAVLAHPFSLKCETRGELVGIVDELVAAGLDGLECYYSEHSKEFTRELIGIARQRGLVVTGGTDYHGKAKPFIKLGSGKGGLKIPYECVHQLKTRLHERSSN